MKMSEVRKGLRVHPNRFDVLNPRIEGTLTSGRLIHSQPPYGEGFHVRVKWDGMPTPENWHLEDLTVGALPVDRGEP